MSASAKILVVDDTPLNVKMLADLLAFKGYQVVTAASGAEGLAKIESEHPDLVLLDVMMPGMNGYEVCQKIRANPATGMLPVVMVTALDPVQERVKGIEAGADDFLAKPINQPELLARVRSLLRVKELWSMVQAQAGQELVFVVTDTIAKLVLQRAAMREIEDQAIKEGMITMKQDGYLKAVEGVTTLEEVLRVAQD